MKILQAMIISRFAPWTFLAAGAICAGMAAGLVFACIEAGR